MDLERSENKDNDLEYSQIPIQGIRIEDLPDEMMVEIFSNLKKTEKMDVSMVNRRWFGIAYSEIKTLSIKWPQEKNQDFHNLIVRNKRIELTVNGLISNVSSVVEF